MLPVTDNVKADSEASGCDGCIIRFVIASLKGMFDLRYDLRQEVQYELRHDLSTGGCKMVCNVFRGLQLCLYRSLANRMHIARKLGKFPVPPRCRNCSWLDTLVPRSLLHTLYSQSNSLFLGYSDPINISFSEEVKIRLLG